MRGWQGGGGGEEGEGGKEGGGEEVGEEEQMLLLHAKMSSVTDCVMSSQLLLCRQNPCNSTCTGWNEIECLCRIDASL